MIICGILSKIVEEDSNQAPEKFLAALAVLGAAWQSKIYVLLGAAKLLQKPGRLGKNLFFVEL